MTKSAGPALRELHRQLGDRVQFVTLYVREAHPGDRFVQPQQFDTKRDQASAYVERDAISWPVLIDGIDGDLHRRLDPKPDAWYLIGVDGAVLARGLWTNALGPLRAALHAAADDRPVNVGTDESRLLPMLRGTGEMWSTLTAAGSVAVRDAALHAPPMAVAAALAGQLPLRSPLVRGVTALGLLTVALAGGAAALRVSRRHRD